MYRALIPTALLAFASCTAPRQTLSPAPQTAQRAMRGKAPEARAIAYLRDGDVISTTEPIALFMSDPADARRNYWVVLAPTSTGPDAGTAQGGPLNTPSGLAFHLQTGMVYVSGAMPIVVNGIIDTSSDGSAYFVDVSSNGPKNALVYLPDVADSLEVEIKPKNGSPVKANDKKKIYRAQHKPNDVVDVDAPATPHNDELDRFEKLLQIARDLGVPPHP